MDECMKCEKRKILYLYKEYIKIFLIISCEIYNVKLNIVFVKKNNI